VELCSPQRHGKNQRVLALMVGTKAAAMGWKLRNSRSMTVKRISVASFAEQIIDSSKAKMISVPQVVAGIREKLPDCEHTDEELSQIVSMIAVNRGRQLSYIRPRGFELVA
jgi:hypothetical protein